MSKKDKKSLGAEGDCYGLHQTAIKEDYIVFTNWDTPAHKTIKILRPKEIIADYLQLIKIESLEKAELKQLEKIFFLIINDYKSGRLSLDKMSASASELFKYVAKKNNDSLFFEAIVAADDLNFAIRTPVVFNNVVRFLEQIEDFYQKYQENNNAKGN